MFREKKNTWKPTGYQKLFLNDPEKDVKPPKVKSIKA